jgi:hypothetical protein
MTTFDIADSMQSPALTPSSPMMIPMPGAVSPRIVMCGFVMT